MLVLDSQELSVVVAVAGIVDVDCHYTLIAAMCDIATGRLFCSQAALPLILPFPLTVPTPPPSPPPSPPPGQHAVPLLTLVCDGAAEVIGTAFFDVEMDALDYSIEDDGSLTLSDRPYLQVSSTAVCLSRQPCQPGVCIQDLGGQDGGRGGGGRPRCGRKRGNWAGRAWGPP